MMASMSRTAQSAPSDQTARPARSFRSPRTLLTLSLAVPLSIAAAILIAQRPAAAQPGDDAPFAPGAREIFVPALDIAQTGGRMCPVELVIQNIGDRPSKGIALFWDAPDGSSTPPSVGPGPVSIECTGLIKPGASWRMVVPMVPTRARSAAIYSATAEIISEIGVDLGWSDVVADYLCEALFFDVVGDAVDAWRFRRAVRNGGEFAGLPMDRALGAPLSVLVDVQCPDGNLRYAGVPSGEALEDLSVERAVYEYSGPWLGASPERSGPSRITAMNTGFEYATLEIFARSYPGDASPDDGAKCPPPAVSCGTFILVPGGSVVVDPIAAGCLDTDSESGAIRRDGGVRVTSDQPLAVVVDGFGPAGRASAAARRVNAGGKGVGPGAGAVAPRADAGIDRLSAPLVMHDYRGWSSVIHVANTSGEEVQTVLSIRDRSGGVVDHRFFGLCPLGGRSLALGVDLVDVPENFVGSLSIQSAGSAIDATGSDALIATVEFVRRAESREPVAAAAYEVRPAASGDALIGIPVVARSDGDGPSTRLAIQNRVTTPGFTDFVIYLFDGSGLVDYVCDKLNERQVEYIDFSTWGYVMPGFTGSAVISATYWEHDDSAAVASPAGDRVALGVVTVDAPNESSATISAAAIPEGPARAHMFAPIEGSIAAEIGRLTCSSGPFERPRTWRAYLPSVSSGAAAGPPPVFPTEGDRLSGS